MINKQGSHETEWPDHSLANITADDRERKASRRRTRRMLKPFIKDATAALTKTEVAEATPTQGEADDEPYSFTKEIADANADKSPVYKTGVPMQEVHPPNSIRESKITDIPRSLGDSVVQHEVEKPEAPIDVQHQLEP